MTFFNTILAVVLALVVCFAGEDAPAELLAPDHVPRSQALVVNLEVERTTLARVPDEPAVTENGNERPTCRDDLTGVYEGQRTLEPG